MLKFVAGNLSKSTRDQCFAGNGTGQGGSEVAAN